MAYCVKEIGFGMGVCVHYVFNFVLLQKPFQLRTKGLSCGIFTDLFPVLRVGPQKSFADRGMAHGPTPCLQL